MGIWVLICFCQTVLRFSAYAMLYCTLNVGDEMVTFPSHHKHVNFKCDISILQVQLDFSKPPRTLSFQAPQKTSN